MKNNLTHINSRESLGLFSLVIVVFLDLFILTAIFQGLEEHTNQLSSPDEQIPPLCREIVIDHDWSQSESTKYLSSVIFQTGTVYGNEDQPEKSPKQICKAVLGKLSLLQKNHEAVLLISTRQKLSDQLEDTLSTIEKIKASYDTLLLQKIAGENQNYKGVSRSDAEGIRREFEEKTSLAVSQKNQIALLDKNIHGNRDIKLFIQEMSQTGKNSRESLAKEYKAITFWFPVKKLLMEFLFLFPVFLVFYYWNSKSLKNNRGLQILVSSHLLIVASIPVFLKIGEAIYDIIPKKLLKAIWDFLVSLNLIALWHYIIIFLAILLGFFLIYVVQKKLFSREKLLEKRLSKGQCVECAMRLPRDSAYCPFCGFHQFKKCPKCKKQTFVHAKFCRECGFPGSEK